MSCSMGLWLWLNNFHTWKVNLQAVFVLRRHKTGCSGETRLGLHIPTSSGKHKIISILLLLGRQVFSADFKLHSSVPRQARQLSKQVRMITLFKRPSMSVWSWLVTHHKPVPATLPKCSSGCLSYCQGYTVMSHTLPKCSSGCLSYCQGYTVMSHTPPRATFPLFSQCFCISSISAQQPVTITPYDSCRQSTSA